MWCELFEPAMCAKIPSNVKLRAAGRNFLLRAATAWSAGGSCKFDFVKVPEVLIDVALGVVGTDAPEVLGKFVSVWRVDDICAVF
ncbi:hypothetical protein M405DRAFT_805028 [Rhizopogon salebrosus TDB-379]|nr:hypothetical protein M405DRAFT_805028 [Rhizopogon salebrosus TDB-379]